MSWKWVFIELSLMIVLILKVSCEDDCGPNAYRGWVTCQCFLGYRMTESRDTGLYQCEAQCTPQCGSNAVCVAPEVCACANGFILENGNCRAKRKAMSTLTPTTAMLRSNATRGDESKEMIDDNGEVGAVNFNANMGVTESATDQDQDDKCPFGYVYRDGDCQLYTDMKPPCDITHCGSNARCVDGNTCECVPGFQWHADGSSMSQHRCIVVEAAKDFSGETTVGLRAEMDRRASDFFTVLGLACIAFALVVLLVILYKCQK